MKKFFSALVALTIITSAVVIFVKMREDKIENDGWEMWVGVNTSDTIDTIEIDGQTYKIDRSATSAIIGHCMIVDSDLVCRMADK